MVSPTLPRELFLLLQSLIYTTALIIETNHFSLVKEIESSQNTPKIKVQASILRELYAPGIHGALNPPALTFKLSGLSIKLHVQRVIEDNGIPTTRQLHQSQDYSLCELT